MSTQRWIGDKTVFYLNLLFIPDAIIIGVLVIIISY